MLRLGRGAAIACGQEPAAPAQDGSEVASPPLKLPVVQLLKRHGQTAGVTGAWRTRSLC
jgi:hypothetical protein